MPKCGNFIYITRRHGCSPVNLLHIFRTPFPKNISGWLLLVLLILSGSIFISKCCPKIQNPFTVFFAGGNWT